MRDALALAKLLALTGLPALTPLLGTPAAPAAAQEAQTTRQAQPMTEYTLSWKDPASHLYEVAMELPAAGTDSVDLQLPVWRPGRYVRQNYAANVQEFSAEDGEGRSLGFRKSGLSTWRVEAAESGHVRVRYRYYANTLDAGASLLSAEEAYFNPVNLFMYAEGGLSRPLRLTIAAPEGWEVATSLTPAGRPNVYTAPDYHTLADAPTIVSPSLESLQFTVDDVPYTMYFQGRFEPGERRDRIVPDVERIVRAQTAIFGSAPFDEYFFLFHLLPYPFGHAVEHANSSSYAIQDNAFESEEAYEGFLGIVAHELFHAWNVKRIRPAALWPYDYTREQLTSLHWFTEGVTSYYAGITLRRAGLIDADRFLRDLGRQIDALQRTPGRKVVPVALASWDSWLSGYGQGNPNLSVNFYGKGQVLGFLLDASIRDRTDGARSLDDVFRQLYATYYEQGRGVPEEGVRLAAEHVAGGSFEEFFRRYVHGTDELPYDRALAPFGLAVRAEPDTARPEADLRIRTRAGWERPVVASIDPESPALAAGLDVGDELVAMNGTAAPAEGWERLLVNVGPGDPVRLTVRRRDRVLDLEVEAAGGGNLRWALVRDADPDARERRLFGEWIGDPTPGGRPRVTGAAPEAAGARGAAGGTGETGGAAAR